MDRTHEARVLSNLLRRGRRLARDSFVSEFPADRQHAIRVAIENLARRGFVESVYREGTEYMELPECRIKDAMRLVSTLGLNDPACVPIEEMIPRSHAAPFHISHGEHEARGHISTYALCRNVRDKYDVSCFVIDARGRRRRIHLGNLADSRSLAAKFLDGIDSAFGGRPFTREEIKGNLPSKITGNNQPTKAAVEYLRHDGYLVRLNPCRGLSRFQRTCKKRPIMSLTKDVMEKDADYRKQTIMYPFYQ